MPAEDVLDSVLGISFYPRQWEAVSAPIGPVLVVAGPGAGKTRCLTGRIGFLIDRCDVAPESICAITFTNKAAREIQQRLRDTLGDRVEELSTGTIHALCLRLLREFTEQAGLRKGFGIADDTHQRMILKRLKVTQSRQGRMLNRFGRRDLEGYKLTDAEEDVYQEYNRILTSHNLIDFNGILYHLRLVLDNHADALQATQGRWSHILVDECQDLDPFQYAIIKHMAGAHRSLFAVGDDDQSIFSFRSADPRLIGRLMRDFDIHTPIVLDMNCRCSKPIFDAARRILPPNQLGFEKQIAAQRDSVSEVRVLEFEDEDAEAEWIISELVKAKKASSLPWGEYALLYRLHAVGEKLEQALIARGIPCQVVRGRALTDDPTVEQLLCALRLIIEPHSWLEVERLARGILGELLLTEVQRGPGENILHQARAFATNRRDEDAKKCWKFYYLVENLRSLGMRESHLRELVSAIIAQGVGRGETVLEKYCDELSNAAELASVKRLGELLIQADRESSVVMVTKADGLEFPVREMIRQALPKLRVDVWDFGDSIQPNSLILVLHEDRELLSHLTETICHWFSEPGLSKITQVFKAVQYASSHSSTRLFDEYICFDTETTGKDTDHCEIIELGAVKVWRGEVVETFRSLIFTEKPISSEATKVHGYTNKDLEGKPTLAEVWPRFRRFTGEHRLVVHNGLQFDVPVVERLTREWDGISGLTLFDSLPLARSLIKDGSLKLEDLAIRFGVDPGRGHHALDDSACLAGVFEKLISEHEVRNRKTCLANLLDAFALGLAIEAPGSQVSEEQLLFKVGRWKALGRYSNLLERYESEQKSGRCRGPALDVIVERLGGKEIQRLARTENRPEDRHPEIFSRLRDLIEASHAGDMKQSVRAFVDTLALSKSDSAPDPDRIGLLTCHATKGLEFSEVYVVGAEDDQMLGTQLNKPDNPEEEREARRLLYVAMTRAKDRLTLTHCKQRNGKPTRGVRLVEELRQAADLQA